MFSSEVIAQSHLHSHGMSRVGIQTDHVNGFIFLGLVIYISTLVFEGPFRFYLSNHGLGSLLYLRDLLALTCVALGITKAIFRHKNIFDPLIITLYTLVLFGTLGVLVHDVSIFSLAFGLKIYLAFLLGMAASESVWIRQKTFEQIVIFFAILTALGVFINAGIGKFPWEGLSYETTFGVVSTTKEWWTEGERRLAGFARASYDAAMILGIASGLLLPSRGRLFSVLIGGTFFVAAYLTTSKSMIAAIAILIMWRIFTPSKYLVAVGQLICATFLILMITLPIISCFFQFDNGLMQQVPRGLSSFAERLISMWPKSCAILTTPTSWIFGGGIGSIGVPQKYISPNDYSAADNLFLYIYVSGGLLLAALLIFTLVKAITNSSLNSPDRLTTIGIIMITTIYGVAINMIEQPFFSIVAGVLFFKTWRHHEQIYQ